MPTRLVIPGISSGGSVRVRAVPWWFKPLAILIGLVLIVLAIVFVLVAIPVGVVAATVYFGFSLLQRVLRPTRPSPLGSGTAADPEVLDADDPQRQNVRVRRPTTG